MSAGVTPQQWPLQWTAANAPWLFGLAFGAPLIGVLKRWPHRMHAVDMDGVIKGSLGRGTFEAACGLGGLRLWGYTANDRTFATPWPPRIKGMPDGFERCRECWEATGRMRPRAEWRAA